MPKNPPPHSLLTLSAIITSEHYPFASIEERHKLIPEPVQKSLILHSFPKEESNILLYSNNEEFNFDDYRVEQVVQIGFMLSGVVFGGGIGKEEAFVRICFDRCKISTVHCTCVSKASIFWCDHIVALALWRIRNAEQTEIRVPISETLSTLTKPQLQKLLQYLVTTHTSVLPTAQKLADELLNKSSIDSIHGAPDPTAGGSVQDDNSWALNYEAMAQCLVECVRDEGRLEEVVKGLFRKMDKMLPTQDKNATKILTTITQTFLAQKLPLSNLWEQLALIWQLVVSCPFKTVQTRSTLYHKTIQNFIKHENMPRNESSHQPLLQNCLNLIKTDYLAHTKDLDLNILKILSQNAHGNVQLAVKSCENLLKSLKSLKTFQIDYSQCLLLYNILYQNELKKESSQFALLCLIQPQTQTTQYQLEKWLKSEAAFIQNLKIQDLNLDSFLSELNILNRQYNNSLPLYNVAKYLYNLNPTNLVFKIALKYLSKQPGTSFLKEILEQSQVQLALILIKGIKNSTQKLNQLLKQLNSIKSSSSLFKIAQESLKIEENGNLTNFSFQLGLVVLKQTLKTSHRKRWDILRWVLNSRLNYYSVLNLLEHWTEYFSPNEVVGSVVSQFLSRGTGLRLGLTFVELKELGDRGRAVAVEALRRDPPQCALNALTICESDGRCFESCYELVLNASKNSMLNAQQIFTIARYMEHRGYPLRAYRLAAIAVSLISIPFNQETHSSITDIHWSCTLAQSLGDLELSNLLPLIIQNIKCGSVLAEILKRAALEPPRKLQRTSTSNRIYSRLKLLVEATITSYVSTIHNRLSHISPRHYSDFIEYLVKAKEAFGYKPEGGREFGELVNSIKVGYKGKKKLGLLLVGRFG